MISWLAIRTFLGRVPREAWYALAAFAAWWVFSSHYVQQGRNELLAELKEAEREAEEKAAKAVGVADDEAAKREAIEKAKTDALQEAINEAEQTGDNPLDALFGGMSR